MPSPIRLMTLALALCALAVPVSAQTSNTATTKMPQKVRGEMMKEMKQERIAAGKRYRQMRSQLSEEKKQRAGELKKKYHQQVQETRDPGEKRQLGNELREELQKLRQDYYTKEKEETEKLKQLKQNNIDEIRKKYSG